MKLSEHPLAVSQDSDAGWASADHIAVAPSGVWVVDVVKDAGKVAVSRPLLGDATLTTGGRDRTELVDRLADRVALVRAAMRDIEPSVAVHGALCFATADLPRLGRLMFDGFALLSPKQLEKHLGAGDEVSPAEVSDIAAQLAQRLGDGLGRPIVATLAPAA